MTRGGRTGLEGSRCRVCGHVACPPQLAHCGEPVAPATLRPVGTIESWSVARVAPERFDPPYAFAYVRLEDGARVFVRLDDWSETDRAREGERVVVSAGLVGRSAEGSLHGLVARRLGGPAEGGASR